MPASDRCFHGRASDAAPVEAGARVRFPGRVVDPSDGAAAATCLPPQGMKSMTRSRRLAIAVLAAATVVVGNVGTPATASAMDCSSARVVQGVYEMTAHALFLLGMNTHAAYWYGRATGVRDGACG